LLDVAAGTSFKDQLCGFCEQTDHGIGWSENNQIVLSETKSQFDDVVVTAYNRKQTREAVVGSVTTVKPGNLKIPASNLTNALAGQVAGVIAYTPSGQPGQDNAQFFIRGVTTFGYKQDPADPDR
jgi:outer membrane cobalamin receptor